MEEDFEDALEAAGAAALDFEDSLASLPSALSDFEDSLLNLPSAISDVEDSFTNLPGALSDFDSALSGLPDALENFADALDSAEGATAASSGAHGGEGGSDSIAIEGLEDLGPEGAAAAAAIAGVTAAAVALSAEAIEVADRVELMKDRFASLAGSAAGGAAVNAMVERLSTTLPFATAQIQNWALALQAAGLQGPKLEGSIKAIAAATALMGEQGGAAAENLIKKLAEGGDGAKKLLDAIQKGSGKSNKLLADMGLSTHDLAAAMGMTDAAFAKATLSADQMNGAISKALQKKGAGPLDDLANGLPSILQKAKEGLLSLFDGLGPSVKPFMASVKSLFGEFSKGGTAIKVLKPIVTSVFGTLLSWATTATNAVHRGFLLVTIAALTAYIALKPIIDKIKEFSHSATGIWLINNALTGLKVTAIVLGVALGIALLPLLLLEAASIAVVVAVVLLVGAIMGLVSAAAGALADWASDAASAASDFVSGLIDGIVSGAGAVVGAVKNLASSALSAFTGAFGIKSPSKVMMKHGDENIAGGAAKGIDKGSDKVDDAMADLGTGKPGTPKGKAGRGGDGGKVENHYHYSGPVEHYETFRENMRRFLEEADAESPS